MVGKRTKQTSSQQQRSIQLQTQYFQSNSEQRQNKRKQQKESSTCQVRFSSPPASTDKNKFQNIATRHKDIFYERTIQLKFREIYDKPPQLQPQRISQQKQAVAAWQQEQQPQH